MSKSMMIEHLEGRRLYAADSFNDTYLANQTDLGDIGASKAWNYTTGSLNVVVADLDTGMAYDHPDLVMNTWINQDEIPGNFKKHLKDTDGDGIISFYDLNSRKNARWMTDFNGNGYIDAGDLLQTTRRGGWEDGIDADGNGYTDDIIGWDFANNDNDPYDHVGHGTHTAGTIAATQGNDYGIAGLAKTSLMVVKIFDDEGNGTTEANIAAAIRYSADEGARVSNNSWGYTLYSNGSYSVSIDAADASSQRTYFWYPPGAPYFPGDDDGQTQMDTIEAAISYAGEKGQTFVAAAGNDSTNNDFSFFGSYPASYDLANIVSVAAVDDAGKLSYFSNYGENTVDLAAPGEDIISTWTGKQFYKASGTSMATPHVTGTLALMLAKYPRATSAQLKSDLLSTVNLNASVYYDLVSGGELNAGLAVRAAGLRRTAAVQAAALRASTTSTTAVATSFAKASLFSATPISLAVDDTDNDLILS